MEKKYQIFISSTYKDLVDERRKVQDTILSMYQFPIGMEMFSAADEEQWEIIKETIDSSDYYVLIIGHRYGSIIENGEYAGFSYTQKEFRYALERKIPVLAFLIDDSVPVTPDKMEQDINKNEKLKLFKQEVKTGRTVQWWTSKDDLANKVMNSLNKQINRGKRPGWVRADGLKLQETQNELVEMSKKIRKLEKENEELKKNIVTKKPKFEIKFNDNNFIEGKYANIEISSLKAEYVITEEYLKTYGAEKVIPQKFINDYNDSLLSNKELKEYFEKYKMFKEIKSNQLPFTVEIDNIGNCKANDVHINIIASEGIKIFDKTMMFEELKEPKAPEILKNPVKKYLDSLILGIDDSIIESLNLLDNSTMHLPSINSNFYNENYSEYVEDDCLFIWKKSLIRTGQYTSDEYYLVPSKKGKFELKVSIICEEFIEEEIQKFDVIIK